MKKIFKKFVFCLILPSLLIAPALVSAEPISLTNPLKYDTVEGLIAGVLNFLWVFALIISPVFILYAGYLFIFAAGDPAKVKKAGQVILYAAIGLLIIGLAKGIVAIIQSVIGAQGTQVETSLPAPSQEFIDCMTRTNGNYPECSGLPH